MQNILPLQRITDCNSISIFLEIEKGQLAVKNRKMPLSLFHKQKSFSNSILIKKLNEK